MQGSGVKAGAPKGKISPTWLGVFLIQLREKRPVAANKLQQIDDDDTFRQNPKVKRVNIHN